MNNETILVVDDAVINLKIVAATLRNEGYRVETSSTAEQAWLTLRTLLPDLMLVDIQLPGMDGLELTRKVRQDPRTSSVLVIAFTAATEDAAREQALQAGCDGFISKTGDVGDLCRSVRIFLDSRAGGGEPAFEEGAPEVPEALTLEGPEMEALRRRFLTEASQEAQRLLVSLDGGFDAKESGGLLHRWVGSAGALGYHEIAATARRGEMLLGEPGWSRKDLRDVCSELAAQFASPPEAAATPIPESIRRLLARQRIALAGFDGAGAERICDALSSVRAVPYLFAVEELGRSASAAACAAVIVHVSVDTMGARVLQPECDWQPAQPVLLAGRREALLALDARVQSRAAEVLLDGWMPEELALRLSFALARAEAAAAHPAVEAEAAEPEPASSRTAVVVADDDPNVLAVVRHTLETLGLEVHAASDGLEALRLLRETKARAAVLDVNMPGKDGFEVLAEIRGEKMPVRVVMLTSLRRDQDVVHGFELGADDYVVKPFSPLELAARLRRLL